MFNAVPNSTLPDTETNRLRAHFPYVVTSVDSVALAPQSRPKPAASVFSKSLDKNVLDLIVYWEQPIAELRPVLDGISDWGPFELTDAAPFAIERNQKMSVFCRFKYHGPKASRGQFEQNLKALLEKYADWDDARPPERPA